MNYRKGVSLYITLVIMAILLSIVLGLTSIITTGAVIAGQVSDAVRAFAAADTGIEIALYNLYQSGSCSNLSAANIQGDTRYNYTVTVGGSCPASPMTITSGGSYTSGVGGTTSRKIQISY